MKAFLVLEDGSIFEGKNLGATKDVISEIVFNTAMTGYLEVLTDPSYTGQAVVMTYPLIGNYGICYEDMESSNVWVDGFIVREAARRPSNFRSEESLDSFLKAKEVTGIQGIDTRTLTKTLREKGSLNGLITTNENFVLEEVVKALKAHKPSGVEVDQVTCKDKIIYTASNYTFSEAALLKPGLKVSPYKQFSGKVAVLDYGSKGSIVECLLMRGCDVTVYPASTTAEDILKDQPDGIMLSNGPGNPQTYTSLIKEIKKLYESNTPIFGICLGHQLMALATGCTTRKLKYGHRGSNHPVKDCKTGRVYISTQNHGYVVEEDSIPHDIAEVYFENVNDKTIEGLHYLGKNIFTVQFHPEASSGPKDTEYLFDEFIQMMEVSK